MSESTLSEADEVEDMVSLRSRRTGVQNTIFLSTKGYARHAQRIRIAIDPPDSLTAASKTVSMATHDYRVEGSGLPAHIKAQAVELIDRDVRRNGRCYSATAP